MKLLSVLCMFTLALFSQPGQSQEAVKQTLPRVETPFAAPDFTLKSESGKTFHLADFRRNIWQHTAVQAVVEAMVGLVHEGWSVKQAIKHCPAG